MMRIAAGVVAAVALATAPGDAPEPKPQACRIAVRARGIRDDLSSCVALVGRSGGTAGWFLELDARSRGGSTGAGVHLEIPERPVVGRRYGFDTKPLGIDSGSAERFVSRKVGDLEALPSATHRADWPPIEAPAGRVSVVFSEVPPEGAGGRAGDGAHGTLSATLPAVDGTGPAVTLEGKF